MPDSPFDYDVFLSFSNSDENLVRPVWQHLTLCGLRVFWSDVTLRQSVGSSWFEVIQDAVARSRHLVLVCSRSSLDSKWVKREYVAFFNYHYSSTRRLVPLLTSSVDIVQLPLFLRELETIKLSAPDALATLVSTVGGVDVSSLQRELARRDEELASLRQEVVRLRTYLAEKRPPLRNESAATDFREPSQPVTPVVEHNHDTSRPDVGKASADNQLRKLLLGDGNDEISRLIHHVSKTTGLPAPVIVAGLLALVIALIVIVQVISAT
jgi:hypothetical protein